MTKNVFILGAGASSHAQAPLMANFLDKAQDLAHEGVSENLTNSVDKVFRVIAELKAVYEKSFIDLTNIEAVFGAIEMAKLINRLGNLRGGDIDTVRNQLINLIVLTLEHSVKFLLIDDADNQQLISPRQEYAKFVNSIIKTTFPETSIITFNYDVALDFELHRNGVELDYCLNKPKDGVVKLLKLHGSINWGTCQCEEIIPYYIADFFRRRNIMTYFNQLAQPGRNVQVVFPINERLNDLREDHTHSGSDKENLNDEDYRIRPTIIPPTWSKSGYHGMITNVWQQAANELSDAINIYILGYSLPETDTFFRYLYSLGTLEPTTNIRRFWVFNPEDSGETEDRYRELIGQGIEERFEYYPYEFGIATEELIQNL